jgi:hypothetical protein
MADKDTDKRPTDEKPRVPNPPTEPLKQDAIGAASPRDPAGNVADSTVTRPTNPGPGAPAAPTGTRPALPAARATPPVFRQQTQPIQPVVPAPSEQVAPGPVGRPDPSRSPEEREATRDAHIEAHAMVNATDPAFAPIAERTVDGEAGRVEGSGANGRCCAGSRRQHTAASDRGQPPDAGSAGLRRRGLRPPSLQLGADDARHQ